MKRVFVLLAGLVTVFALAACSGDGSGKTAVAATSAGAHNDQDVAFFQGMISHHQQAIEVARLARTRSSMREVKKLALGMEAAQDPEIRLMTSWLESWGAAVPSDDMGHGMGDMGGLYGMLSRQEMNGLKKLSGKRFDKAFLTTMIEHHQGAITMARTEQAKGLATKAKFMASGIIKTQSAEITRMRALLARM